jgi:hypothetical protein
VDSARSAQKDNPLGAYSSEFVFNAFSLCSEKLHFDTSAGNTRGVVKELPGRFEVGVNATGLESGRSVQIDNPSGVRSSGFAFKALPLCFGSAVPTPRLATPEAIAGVIRAGGAL